MHTTHPDEDHSFDSLDKASAKCKTAVELCVFDILIVSVGVLWRDTLL